MSFNYDPDFRCTQTIASMPGSLVRVFGGMSISRNLPVVYKAIECRANVSQHISRLQIEARVMRAMRSPNICQVYESKEVCTVEGTVYFCIVMERLSKDWLQEIERKPKEFYRESELWERLYVLVATLAELQRLGIAHRDIKPQNILLTTDPKPRVKLADFDSCKLLIAEQAKASLQGTPTYLSPKLHRAWTQDQQKDVVHDMFKSDVFSLGLTFLHAATLHAPDQSGDQNQFQAWKENAISGLRYSARFKAVLGLMLAEEEVSRPNFQSLAERLKVVPNISSPVPVLSTTPACYVCGKLCTAVPFLSLPCHHLFSLCSLPCFNGYSAESAARLHCTDCGNHCSSSDLAPFLPQLKALFRPSW